MILNILCILLAGQLREFLGKVVYAAVNADCEFKRRQRLSTKLLTIRPAHGKLKPQTLVVGGWVIIENEPWVMDRDVFYSTADRKQEWM